LFSCHQKNSKPDTSSIAIKLETKRFEKDFFNLDTNNLDQGMEALHAKYPAFLVDFTTKILGLRAVDTASWNSSIIAFIRDYRSIFDSTRAMDKALIKAEEEIRVALKHVKYYFPQYPLPEQFISFIGPMDALAFGETGAYSDIITPSALCTGLQLHLGSNSMVYQSEQGMQLYPRYISTKFSPAYISINCIKNIIDDLQPPMPSGKTLLDIMVDHGKRMYLLDLFMPDLDEPLKTGYTETQWKAAVENEGLIWNYFTENKLLFETDLIKIRSFISDGPSTVEFGEGSPGFISLFTGKKIILAYMNKHPSTTIDHLLSMNAQEILQGAAYKPR
jgi:hypothetical protein